MIKKRKIWQKRAYCWEVDKSRMYLSQDKDKVWIVRFLTEQELDGFYPTGYGEPDFLEMEIDKDSSEEYVIEHTFDTAEFLRLAELIKKEKVYDEKTVSPEDYPN